MKQSKCTEYQTLEKKKLIKQQPNRTFLVVQWLRIHLPVQATQV